MVYGIHDDEMKILISIQGIEIKHSFHVQILHTFLIKSRLAKKNVFFLHFNHFLSTQ